MKKEEIFGQDSRGERLVAIDPIGQERILRIEDRILACTEFLSRVPRASSQIGPNRELLGLLEQCKPFAV